MQQEKSLSPIFKSELPTEIAESLERRIISMDILGELSEPTDESLIAVHVTGDTLLSDPDGEKVASLKCGILVCNGLLLARGWITPSQLQDYSTGGGFSPSHFKRRMDETRGALTQITGLLEPIMRAGHGPTIRYRLHPSLAFLDKRSNKNTEIWRNKVQARVPSLEDFQPGALEFADSTSRCITFSSMLSKYTNHPVVASALTSWMREGNISRELSPQDLHQLFVTIDKGLVAHLHKTPGASDLSVIQDAIAAYYKIHATVLPFIDRLAKYFGRTYPDLRSDFFQAAATENIRFIQEFEGGRSPEECEHFYKSIQKLSRGTMLVGIANTLRHQRGLTRDQYDKTQAIQTAQKQLQDELKRSPTLSEIVNKLDNAISPTEAQALVHADTNRILSLDAGFELAKILPADNAEADFDLQLDLWMIEEEAQRVFDDRSPLDDLEKIVLSLYFELFSSHLRGMEYRHRPNKAVTSKPPTHVFIYPFTAEDFRNILRSASPENVDNIQQKNIGHIIGATQSGVSAILSRALKKSKTLYVNNEELAEIVG